MKKQLLSIFSALMVGSVMAQTPSPSFTNQDATFPNPFSVTNPGIKFLDAVDANVVWAIGYDAAAPNRNYNWYSRSINGGTSFNSGNVFADTNTYQIANMEGIDANTAWVSSFMKATQGSGAIHRTTNGGATWINMTAAGMFTNSTAFTNIVSFFTPSIGITQGDPVNGEFEIWRTTDGGNNWTMVPGANIPNPLSSAEFAIVDLYYKLGSSNLWFGTNAGRIYRTTDAGLTWNVSAVGAPSDVILEIAFSSPLNGICYVSNGTTVDVYNTFNGGSTWTKITPTGNGLNDISGVPGTGMLISVGNGATNQVISTSADNGLTWTDLGSQQIGYINVDFVNGTTGWVGTYDITNFGNLWKYNSAMTGTVDPLASFYLPTYICSNSSNTGTAQIVNNSNGGPAPTFSWSSSPAAVFSSATASAPTVTFATNGTYTLTLVATNSVGTNSSSQVVTVATCTAATASFTVPSSACTGYTFSATNLSTGSPAPTYSWSILAAGGTTITPSTMAANPDIKVTTPGTYTVSLTASNPAGNSTATQTISIAACPPVINFSIPSTLRYCDSKTITTVNTTTNPPGATPPITYTWTILPNSQVGVFPNYFQPNLLVTFPNNGTPQYTVTLRAKNASGTSSLTQVIAIDYCVVGLQQNALATVLGVYPNPVHDQLNVSLPATSELHTLKLTNILGTVLYSESTLKESVSINMANQPKGVYFLTVESKSEKVTKKIVLE